MIENNQKNEAFRKLEQSEIELEQITTMLWYVIEDYYILNKADLFTKANNYERLETFLYNIHNSLLNIQKDMQNFVEKGYKEEHGNSLKCI